MRPIIWLALTASASWLTNCRSQEPILIESYAQAKDVLAKRKQRHRSLQKDLYLIGPYADAPIFQRRANPASEALLTGHIKLLLENGKIVPQPSALVVVGDKLVSADAVGNYAVALPPGRYGVRAGGIGLLWSLASPLQVEAGDSIYLDFKLLGEVRPTSN